MRLEQPGSAGELSMAGTLAFAGGVCFNPLRLGPFHRAPAVLASDRNLARSVFCLLLAAYSATFAGLPENPDAEVEFQTTSALVRNQSFALGGTSEAQAIVSMTHMGRQGFNVRPGGPGREGRFYSWSGVGQALVAFPLYIAGAGLARLLPELEERHRSSTHLGVQRSEYFEHLLVGWRNPILGALTGALVCLAARRAGARRAHAWLCGLAYGLCTFAWPQARGTLSDVQATFFLFLAFVLALGIADQRERNQPRSTLELVSFGLALGGAFLTRAVVAPAVAVLALFFAFECFRAGRRSRAGFPGRELALAFLPALACLCFFLWINERRFGDPLETGYGGAVTKDWFLRSPVPGALGLLVSPGSGMLWMAPALVLLPVWHVSQLRRRENGLFRLQLALFATLFLPIALIPAWHGAWCYGPRYILPLLPFLWFGLGPALGLVWERTIGRWCAAALLSLGLLTALPGVLVDYNTHLDLALQAARLEWPDVPGPSEIERDDDRFVRAKFDWRFAAPWAHWRILRHRVAGLGETFPVRELFFLDRSEVLEPQQEQEKGFRHLAWVDFHRRLGGPTWPAVALCVVLLAIGMGFALRGLDPDQP